MQRPSARLLPVVIEQSLHGLAHTLMLENDRGPSRLRNHGIEQSDEAALAAVRTLARREGIIPALESAHALAELIVRAPRMSREDIVILNVSGRGDKDMDILARAL